MLRRLHVLLLRVYRRLPRRGRLFVVHRLAPSFSVGAICIVRRADDAVLLVRHSYRERWGLPGGLLKRGESAPDGARREAREELGIDIELDGEPTVVVDPRPRRVDVIFTARLSDGSSPDAFDTTSPEILEARWFPSNELPELQHEAAGAMVAWARARLPAS